VTLNPVVTLENGNAVSWAYTNSSSGSYYNLYITNIDPTFPLKEVNLVVTAYNSDGDEATGLVKVTMDNYDPYNDTDPTYTYIRGAADDTVDLTTLIKDNDNGDDDLVFAFDQLDINDYDCIAISNDFVLTITPDTQDDDCDDFSFDLTGTDIHDNDHTIQVSITITNTAPAFTAVSDVTIYDNISFTHVIDFTDYVTDDENATQTLHYSINGEPTFMSTSTSGTEVTFTGTALAANIDQTYYINLVASDGYDSGATTIKFIVLENYQPVAPLNFTINLLEGDDDDQTISAFTDGDGDAITYT
jgi:hypothetical protein